MGHNPCFFVRSVERKGGSGRSGEPSIRPKASQAPLQALAQVQGPCVQSWPVQHCRYNRYCEKGWQSTKRTLALAQNRIMPLAAQRRTQRPMRPKPGRLMSTGSVGVQTILFEISPRPSTATRISSPGTNLPTPAGVPVRIKSPAANRIDREMKLIVSGTDQIIWDRSPS